ncbi:glycosyltransferase family 2 protein [Frankia sp. AiPa1]|uniref:glycosyltransferase family 2 protein n=1 Tax=Frankia sp. AiPa1 TaxID=573492 RepID=UPI0027E4711B|nr:glycosyltransferase family 2 protein [Frankia sp. AiPa1]
MHSLCAVVVSHGGSSHLSQLLSALVTVEGCQVVLVENGTLNGDLVPDGVRVIEGQGNVGYGTAVNIAVRRVVEEGGASSWPSGTSGNDALNWVLVINSDVTIPADTVAALPDLLARYPPSIDAVGFPFLDSIGGPVSRSQAVLPTPRTNAFISVRGEAAAIARWPHLRYPVGAFFAIRVRTYLELGGFDPSFWMYYEETDLFARLYASGGRIVWADDEWPVVHRGGETVGRSPLLHAELGRAAAVYARRHRATVGRSWPLVHAGQLGLLTIRKLAAGHPRDAQRAARILAGLVGGLTRPSWEPAVRSRWRAVPMEERLRLGRVPRPHHDAAGFEPVSNPAPLGPVPSGPAPSGPDSSGAVMPGAAAPDSAASGSVVPSGTGLASPPGSGPARPIPAPSGPEPSGVGRNGPETPAPMRSGPMRTGPVRSGLATSGSVTAKPVPTGPTPMIPIPARRPAAFRNVDAAPYQG